jgi:hypothetical protein
LISKFGFIVFELIKISLRVSGLDPIRKCPLAPFSVRIANRKKSDPLKLEHFSPIMLREIAIGLLSIIETPSLRIDFSLGFLFASFKVETATK